MQFIPFNSRKDYHKSPVGAVSTGEKVIFRIVLPKSEMCSGVRLRLFSDAGKMQTWSFDWEKDEGDSEEWWQLQLISPETGVWWYDFEYDTPYSTKTIALAYKGNAVIGNGRRWQLTVTDGRDTTPDWLMGGIIYQIFPDRFYKSGKTKVPDDRPDDVIRTDWGNEPMWAPDKDGRINNYDFFGGDLKGIEEKLPYLKSLGVTCVYLNPIFKARSNHRYDTGDYMRIDPMLGTQKDFESLCKKGKEMGIRFVLDGVFSHTGAESKYFDKFGNYGGHGAYSDPTSPYRDWYKFNKWPDDYTSWWGVDVLPELVEENPSVLQYFTGENGVARHWLKLGASGWRLDVADELPDEFLDKFNEAVKKEKKDGFIYGEVWEDATNKISYSQRRRYLLGGQLDSVMNYPFANAIVNFVKYGDAENLAETVESIAENYPKSAFHTLMNHIGTHDTVRAITSLGRFKGRNNAGTRDRGLLNSEEYERGVCLLKLASVLQFTLPGVPSIYYGDEAGLYGGEDPYNRGCYPWGNEDEELIEHYKKLAKIRKSNGAFKCGDYKTISAALGCVAFERIGDDERLLIIANANDHDIDYIVHEPWRDAKALWGEDVSGFNVHIDANSAVILKKEI